MQSCRDAGQSSRQGLPDRPGGEQGSEQSQGDHRHELHRPARLTAALVPQLLHAKRRSAFDGSYGRNIDGSLCGLGRFLDERIHLQPVLRSHSEAMELHPCDPGDDDVPPAAQLDIGADRRRGGRLQAKPARRDVEDAGVGPGRAGAQAGPDQHLPSGLARLQPTSSSCRGPLHRGLASRQARLADRQSQTVKSRTNLDKIGRARPQDQPWPTASVCSCGCFLRGRLTINLSILRPSISTISNDQPSWRKRSPVSGRCLSTERANPATVE